MPPMLPPERSRPRPLALALACSLLLHGLILFCPQRQTPRSQAPARRLEALLPAAEPQRAESEPAPAAGRPPRARDRLAVTRPGHGAAPPPRWTTAQKADMNRFLDELAAAPRPTLAERARAAARQMGHQATEDQPGAVLELRPNSPPVDPFSLDMYVDGLVRKLNRSAAFVRNDPRTKGVRTATVQFRVNPDGSLNSFRILNAGDQKDEIAFIRSVVEQAAPFARFPADLDRAAQSLAMNICIIPGGGSGGFGFTRVPDGQSC